MLSYVRIGAAIPIALLFSPPLQAEPALWCERLSEVTQASVSSDLTVDLTPICEELQDWNFHRNAAEIRSAFELIPELAIFVSAEVERISEPETGIRIEEIRFRSCGPDERRSLTRLTGLTEKGERLRLQVCALRKYSQGRYPRRPSGPFESPRVYQLVNEEGTLEYRPLTSSMERDWNERMLYPRLARRILSQRPLLPANADARSDAPHR